MRTVLAGDTCVRYEMSDDRARCSRSDGDGVIVVTLTGYQRDLSSSGGGSLVEGEEEGTSIRRGVISVAGGGTNVGQLGTYQGRLYPIEMPVQKFS